MPPRLTATPRALSAGAMGFAMADDAAKPDAAKGKECTECCVCKHVLNGLKRMVKKATKNPKKETYEKALTVLPRPLSSPAPQAEAGGARALVLGVASS